MGKTKKRKLRNPIAKVLQFFTSNDLRIKLSTQGR